MSSELDINELERLLNEATPKPWQHNGSHVYGTDPERVAVCALLNLGGHEQTTRFLADLEAIPAARNAAPALIARIRELESENFRLQSDLIAARADVARKDAALRIAYMWLRAPLGEVDESNPWWIELNSCEQADEPDVWERLLKPALAPSAGAMSVTAEEPRE